MKECHINLITRPEESCSVGVQLAAPLWLSLVKENSEDTETKLLGSELTRGQAQGDRVADG